jgi:hypothetical protein
MATNFVLFLMLLDNFNLSRISSGSFLCEFFPLELAPLQPRKAVLGGVDCYGNLEM